MLRRRPRSLLDLPVVRPGAIPRPRPEPRADNRTVFAYLVGIALGLVWLVAKLALELGAAHWLRRAGPSPW